jgi:hypothetical protein
MSDAPFNTLAEQVLQIVREYSVLAKPIVSHQCERIGKTPATLELQDLGVLAEAVGKAVGNFTTPVKGQLAEHAIRRLRREG